MKMIGLAFAFMAIAAIADEVEPIVKLSANGICHTIESPHYNRTKNFVEYATLEECIEAGGREVKK
jgi:hypothetical protein